MKMNLALLVFVSLVGSMASADDYVATLGNRFGLASCGGTVLIKVTQNQNSEALTLDFKDIKDCSNFDILAKNGTPINYKSKKFEQDARGYYYGSRTIPKKAMGSYGWNDVSIIVKSNNNGPRGHRDTITIVYGKQPVGTGY